MKLHGFNVLPNDPVYTTIDNLGQGTVHNAPEGGPIECKFGEITISVDENGVRPNSGSKPVVFWHDPIVVMPPKSPEYWQAVSKISKTAVEAFTPAIEAAMGVKA